MEWGISYLRVSTKRQMNTGADVETDGNSISTQREYVGKKSAAMGVEISKEFVEPGNSAQTIAKRKVFRELLAYLKEHPDIKYVFIYMRSRAFRNYLEAGNTEKQLKEMGVKLISAKEEFGEGIMADAMKAVTDIMNEVQVRLSGQDISTKMQHKADHGGTNGLAAVGYLNGVKHVDGRKVNTVIVDEERRDYVVMAFKLFATGRYSNIDELRDKLTDMGLRMPRTNSPIAKPTLYKMLRNRYYVGFVTYKGIERQGRHEPLISEELFDRVQRVFESHSGVGNRNRQHHHYLKGTIWCNGCKQRYMIQKATGKSGGIYFYWFCGGYQDGTCDRRFVPLEVMEKAVELHYDSAVTLSEEYRQAARELAGRAAGASDALSDDVQRELNRKLQKLDQREDYFLDLAADEEWSKQKLNAKVASIRSERISIRRQLADSQKPLDTGLKVLYAALDLLDDPAAMYRRGNETVRTLLNRVLFERLYVDTDKVVADELRGPFQALRDAYRVELVPGQPSRTYHRRTAVETNRSVTPACDAPELGTSLSEVVDEALTVRGLSTSTLVGPERLELSLART
jgi:site-specific DNA recombinase